MNWWKIMPFFCYFTFFHLVPDMNFTNFTIFPSSQWFFSFFLQRSQFHQFFVNSIIFLPLIFLYYYEFHEFSVNSMIFHFLLHITIYSQFHEFSVNSIIFPLFCTTSFTNFPWIQWFLLPCFLQPISRLFYICNYSTFFFFSTNLKLGVIW